MKVTLIDAAGNTMSGTLYTLMAAARAHYRRRSKARANGWCALVLDDGTRIPDAGRAIDAAVRHGPTKGLAGRALMATVWPMICDEQPTSMNNQDKAGRAWAASWIDEPAPKTERDHLLEVIARLRRAQAAALCLIDSGQAGKASKLLTAYALADEGTPTSDAALRNLERAAGF